jgi:hypothetical protein
MLSTRQLYRSNNQPASYAALTQFPPEPSREVVPELKKGLHRHRQGPIHLSRMLAQHARRGSLRARALRGGRQGVRRHRAFVQSAGQVGDRRQAA